jgi:uncharacterized protein YihD (DUF1040 family)
MEKSALFINKVVEDKEFEAALIVATQTAVSKEEKIAATTKFANEAGFEVSSVELQKFVENILNTSALLSDDALDSVAGGTHSDTGEDVGTVVGTAAGVGLASEGGPGTQVIAGSAGGAVGGYIGGKYGNDIADGTKTATNTVTKTATSTAKKVTHVFHGW